MENKFNEDNFNRLAGLIIELNPELADMGLEGYHKAVDILRQFTITLVCGDEIKNSAALQSALITSINTAKRCFLGGVKVVIEGDCRLLIPWEEDKTLIDVIREFEAEIVNEYSVESIKLFYGLVPTDSNSMQVICNGWQGGIIKKDSSIKLDVHPDFALGGAFAGALGVGLAFLKQSGLSPFCFDNDTGMSLWRPDIEWFHPNACGPTLTYLPDKFWVVGLGHLGQANVWSIGLLPYLNSSNVKIQLQDIDRVVLGNFEAGLLCDKKQTLNKKKTEVCSEWLRKRGFDTNLVERKYDVNTVNTEDDPFYLLSGLDTAHTRRMLIPGTLKCILDTGVGGGLDFDKITFYNFPTYKKTPAETWKDVPDKIQNHNIKKMTDKELGCGFVKGISTSFVGAIASCLSISELLRGFNSGIKVSIISITIRNLKDRVVVNEGIYNNELNTGMYQEIK